MKTYFKVMLIVIFSLTIVLSGCGNNNIKYKLDEAQLSSKEATTSQTQPPTEPETQPEEKELAMVDYYGYTIDEAIESFGYDYTISEYLYGGGWGYFYYKTGECPFTVYFKSDVTTMGTIPSTKDKIKAIGYSGSVSTPEVKIHDDVTTDVNGTAVETQCPHGEWFEDVDSGALAYSYNYTEKCGITYYWYDKDSSHTADSILVHYNY